jgi:hypothetical protein
MQSIGNRRIHSFIDGHPNITKVTNYQVRSKRGLSIGSFPALVERVAELWFYNPEQMLLFRGQDKEYFSVRDNTSIKPSIFRPENGSKKSPPGPVVDNRYRKLKRAEKKVVDAYQGNHFLGYTRITRSRLLQWAIIQHYEVCDTPLLDVTHSLRVAASFALSKDTATDPVVYVLAVPSLAGTITVCPDHEIQIVRLAGICPPNVARPHFQEGYLLGGYPDLTSYEEKQNYKPYEVDFGARLIAKFHLSRQLFSADTNYPPIPYAALYPDGRDELFPIAQQIKAEL